MTARARSAKVTGLCTFLFDTSTAALWAEEVASTSGIPAEVVAAPANSKAKCDLALVTRAEHRAALAKALTAEGVAFRPWP